MFESIAVVSTNTKTHNVSQNSSWNFDFTVLKPDLLRRAGRQARLLVITSVSTFCVAFSKSFVCLSYYRVFKPFS